MKQLFADALEALDEYDRTGEAEAYARYKGAVATMADEIAVIFTGRTLAPLPPRPARMAINAALVTVKRAE